MRKTRNAIPKTAQDALLKEFNHRCAACGADRPHHHRVDQDAANTDPRNLIPLCPSCHLGGQHDASNAIPQPILESLCRHKHRFILKPQFRPPWNRIAFLHGVAESDDTRSLEDRAGELVSLVSNFEKGAFYAEQLAELPAQGNLWVMGNPASAARRRAQTTEHDREYRQQLRDSLPEVERLVVELLDFQNWSADDGRSNLP